MCFSLCRTEAGSAASCGMGRLTWAEPLGVQTVALESRDTLCATRCSLQIAANSCNSYRPA